MPLNPTVPSFAVTPPPSESKEVEVVTLRDVTDQILRNAEVLFNLERDLKVITGQSEGGRIHHTAIVSSDLPGKGTGRDQKEYHVIVNGPGGSTRRDSMMSLLDETERMVAKHVLKR